MGQILVAVQAEAAVREDFDRHIAAQASVLRLVDHTHPTATEFLCDSVMADGLPDHGFTSTQCPDAFAMLRL